MMSNEFAAVEPPFALNAWKHHLGFIRASVLDFARDGESGYQAVLQELLRVGTNTLDLYTGALGPEEITAELGRILSEENILEKQAYENRLRENDDFFVLDLPDGSQWVFREGRDASRYIHIHPAKHQGPCLRFRGNSLKTAAALLTRLGIEAIQNGPPDLESIPIELVNEVRSNFPGLSPIVRLTADSGPAELMQLLAGPKSN